MSEELTQLMERLRSEEGRRRSQMRGLLALWSGVLMGFLVLLAAFWYLQGPPDAALCLIFAGAFASVPLLFTVNSRHQEAIRLAAEINHPLLVPHLLDILDGDSASLRGLAKTALRHSLTQVSVSMQPHFDQRHVHMLVRLATGKDSILACEAIRALGAVGNAEALRELERLSKEKSKRNPGTADAVNELRFNLSRARISEERASAAAKQEVV